MKIQAHAFFTQDIGFQAGYRITYILRQKMNFVGYTGQMLEGPGNNA